MTTVLRRGRLKIAIYREADGQHHSAHCHVCLLDAEAIFGLESLECLANSGFRKKAIKDIQKIVAEHQDEFLDFWRTLNDEE